MPYSLEVNSQSNPNLLYSSGDTPKRLPDTGHEKCTHLQEQTTQTNLANEAFTVNTLLWNIEYRRQDSVPPSRSHGLYRVTLSSIPLYWRVQSKMIQLKVPAPTLTWAVSRNIVLNSSVLACSVENDSTEGTCSNFENRKGLLQTRAQKWKLHNMATMKAHIVPEWGAVGDEPARRAALPQNSGAN